MLEMVQRMVESGAQADYDTLVETNAASLFLSGLAGMIIICPAIRCTISSISTDSGTFSAHAVTSSL